MSTEELSNEFDTLVDSYRRFKKFDSKEELDSLDFNEYEKSVFLTRALEDTIIDLYNGKNVFKDSFEDTEEIRRYLSTLIRTDSFNPIYNSSNLGLSDYSYFFLLPKDIMFITYESVNFNSKECKCNSLYNEVVPITQDEYHRIKNNPFRNASRKRALRLDLENNQIEIISKYKIESYLIRYLKKPNPIILIDLPNNLTINGLSTKTDDCEIDSTLHKTILDRAVKLALQSKISK